MFFISEFGPFSPEVGPSGMTFFIQVKVIASGDQNSKIIELFVNGEYHLLTKISIISRSMITNEREARIELLLI